MFTGIVQETPEVVSVRRLTESLELSIRAGELAREVQPGDSVMVDGVCLTATTLEGGLINFDVATETARLTTLGDLNAGMTANVELAMRPSDRFGGHFVSGHVDGTGEVLKKNDMGGEIRMRVGVPTKLTDLMIPKGSVAVSGISLTIAELGSGYFEVSLIPHTMKVTTLDSINPGDKVNIECDMIGKWVRKFICSPNESGKKEESGGLTLERVSENLGG